MQRGPARLLLAFALFFCPGCTTALLWDWAGEEDVAGQLVGVIPDVRGDVVLYQFDQTPEFRGGTVGVRIAPAWRALALETLVSTQVGDALALAAPFAPVDGIPIRNVAGPQPLRLVDYRDTVGRQVVVFAPGESRYGYVELMNDRGEVVQEIYGYHGGRAQWVRLASVNLGAFRPSSAKVSAGIALTPVTLVLDVAIFTAIVWAICAGGGGGGVSGLDFPSGGGGGSHPEIIRFSERARYWESLAEPARPFR